MNRKKRKDRQNVSGAVGVEDGGTESQGRLPSRAAACPDLDRYRHHVDHFDLTETQKTDLLLTVWRIMQSFVDRAFGDDPVQHARDARQRSLRNGPVRPVIDVQPDGKSRDDDNDLSGAFSRHAADENER